MPLDSESRPDEEARKPNATSSQDLQQRKRRGVSRLFMIEAFLVVLIVGWLTAKIAHKPSILQEVIPEYVYELRFERTVQPTENGEVMLHTFLPDNHDHQSVASLDLSASTLDFSQSKRQVGSEAIWESSSTTSPRRVGYTARITSRPTRYQIMPDLMAATVHPEHLHAYLRADAAVQSDEATVIAKAVELVPADNRSLLVLLRSIHDFTYRNIKNSPKLGDATPSTTLMLGSGNAYSKSALLAALLRANGQPARMIQGRLMNQADAPLHYWCEVFVVNRWVPLCASHGYFAEIPEHYLRLADPGETDRAEALVGFVIQETTAVRKFLSPRSDQMVTPPVEGDPFNLLYLMKELGLDSKASGLFLMFPMAALLIAFFRNVVGLASFGVFMPMLIAAACRYTGLIAGMTVFILVIVVAAIAHLYMDRIRMHKVPRIAAVITVITAMMIGLLFFEELNFFTYFGFLAMFPVIILSFTADQLHEFIEERDWSGLWKTSLSTVLMVLLCYIVYSSALLRSVFGAFPELIIVVLMVQLWIGRWTALRLSEYVRFHRLIRANRSSQEFDPETSILGLNERNRSVVRTRNKRDDIRTADDKILAKQALEAGSVPTARKLFTVEAFIDEETLRERCEGITEMVIKPAMGSQGRGILLLVGRRGDDFIDPSGTIWTLDDVQSHICQIFSGNYSKNQRNDRALVEELFHPDESLDAISVGIPDIRVILQENEPIAAMLRLPTSKSDGKSNLHMGAVGVDVDLKTGRCANAAHMGRPVTAHPDTGVSFEGFQVPHWQRVLEVAKGAQKAIPLGYAGVDICIDKVKGPVVLEINARPGIEIQNIRQEGLRAVIERELTPIMS